LIAGWAHPGFPILGGNSYRRCHRAVIDHVVTAKSFLAANEQAAARPDRVLHDVVAECRRRLGADPAVLDCTRRLGVADRLPGYTVFTPPGRLDVPAGGPGLPYFDDSVDVVVTSAADPFAMDEARRVARSAVVSVPDAGTRAAGGPAVPAVGPVVEWKRARAERPPTCSIVVPVHNLAGQTATCLAALQETLPPNFAGEVIIVDDASSDDTPAMLAATPTTARGSRRFATQTIWASSARATGPPRWRRGSSSYS
jgi:hypothetical protein